VLLLSWNEQNGGISIKSLPPLPFAVTNAAAVASGNRVYLAGGETSAGVSAQFLSLDLENISNGWINLPSLPQETSHAVMTIHQNAQGTSIFLAGGRKKNANGISDRYVSLLAFDLERNQWKQKSSLPYPLSAGTGITTQQGQLLLFGGDRGETFHQAEKLIAAIEKEKDPVARQKLNEEKISRQANHPGFSREILLYDPRNDEWKSIGNIPFDTPVTTTAIRWGNRVNIPSGEIRAGIRSPKILEVTLPGGKLNSPGAGHDTK
jgi:N-acetylneuraminic acid mutarotase